MDRAQSRTVAACAPASVVKGEAYQNPKRLQIQTMAQANYARAAENAPACFESPGVHGGAS